MTTRYPSLSVGSVDRSAADGAPHPSAAAPATSEDVHPQRERTYRLNRDHHPERGDGPAPSGSGGPGRRGRGSGETHRSEIRLLRDATLAALDADAGYSNRGPLRPGSTHK